MIVTYFNLRPNDCAAWWSTGVVLINSLSIFITNIHKHIQNIRWSATAAVATSYLHALRKNSKGFHSSFEWKSNRFGRNQTKTHVRKSSAKSIRHRDFMTRKNAHFEFAALPHSKCACITMLSALVFLFVWHVWPLDEAKLWAIITIKKIRSKKTSELSFGFIASFLHIAFLLTLPP